MKYHIHCNFINFYNDQHEELFLNDLGNINKVLAKFDEIIKSHSIKYESVDADSNLYRLVMANELNLSVDAIVFFELDKSSSVTALVIYSLNRIDAESKEFMYSVGYCVQEGHRGSGVANRIIVEGIAKLRLLLDMLGPNLGYGPDKSFSYTLESVVSQQNESSNRLAANLLYSGGVVTAGKEYRSQELSNVYRLSL